MQRKVQLSNEAARTLVEGRPQFYQNPEKNIFITISPNEKTKHAVYRGNKTVSIPYGSLPQRVQFDYCLRIVQSCYVNSLSDDAVLVGVPELNERGNVHFHILLNDPAIKNDIYMKVFRRDISCCDQVLKNRAKGKVNAPDYMNNIVWQKDEVEDRIEYMDKEHTDLFKTFYLDPLDDPLQPVFTNKEKNRVLNSNLFVK